MTETREEVFETARRWRIKPPIVALVSGLSAFGLESLWSVPLPLSQGTGLVIAGLLALPALGAGVWALGLFERRQTTHDPFGEPAALATTGPYRLSRNPMYLGVAFILLGVALVRGTFAFLAAPAIFLVTINALFVPHEERLLEKLFPGDFPRYKARVRRWL